MNEESFQVELSIEEVMASLRALPPNEQLALYQLFVEEMEQREDADWELLPESPEAANAFETWLFRRQNCQ